MQLIKWEETYRSGLAHQQAGRLDAAEASFRAVILANPGFAPAHYNLGVVLFTRGRFPKALLPLETAVQLDPSYAEARTGLGVVLTRTGDYARAETELRAAIAAAPQSARTHRALGDLLRTLGRFAEARAAYAEALRCDPKDVDARFGIAFVRLANGEMPEAWDDYELRRSRGPTDPALLPVWRGENPAGKILLVHGEQGLGDNIQFLRYVPLLAAKGAKVLLAVPPPMMTLAASVEGANVLQPSHTLSRFHYSCPLPSLPRIFGTTLATVPAAVPYLAAEESRVAQWRERLGRTDDLTVAIAWRGNPDHPDDYRRSIALATIAPLLQAPGVRFLVVQKDDREIAEAANIRRMGANDLDDIAAILSLADLTISVDTIFCHLAGALGRPVWTLLSFAPDWRWQFTGEIGPWYPTMRLFRQPAPDDWAGLMPKIASALAEAIASRPGH